MGVHKNTLLGALEKEMCLQLCGETVHLQPVLQPQSLLITP